jgi:hypothetical protein
MYYTTPGDLQEILAVKIETLVKSNERLTNAAEREKERQQVKEAHFFISITSFPK